jgi:hypothetical protein
MKSKDTDIQRLNIKVRRLEKTIDMNGTNRNDENGSRIDIHSHVDKKTPGMLKNMSKNITTSTKRKINRNILDSIDQSATNVKLPPISREQLAAQYSSPRKDSLNKYGAKRKMSENQSNLD